MQILINILSNGVTVLVLAFILLTLVMKVFTNSKASNQPVKDVLPAVPQVEPADTLEEPVREQPAKQDAEISDSDLIAVLTAAVMASMGRDHDIKLRVTSFRRLPQTAPIWNTVGKRERISTKL